MQQPEKLTLKIPNMRCQDCLDTISKATGKLKGVEEVSGDIEEKTVYINFRSDLVDPEKIRGVILKQGFLVG